MTSTGGYSFAQLAAEQNQKSKDKFGLYRAVDDGNIECVRKILEAGADVNEADSSGFTALHVAARNGNLEVVELLVEHKANVNARLDRGLTPTYLASREGRTNVVREISFFASSMNSTCFVVALVRLSFSPSSVPT
jgi:ankyrin repeat protein